MALRTILEYPDPRLRTQAQPMTRRTSRPSSQQLIDDMFETMYAAPGIGLAATQVDFHKRLLVIDVSKERDRAAGLHQPRDPERSEGVGTHRGGCLSVPGRVRRGGAGRRRSACARWTGTASAFERDCDDILAVCVQHEMDHLEGKLFVDYLSDLKRERIRKKLDKDRKERAAKLAEQRGRAPRVLRFLPLRIAFAGTPDFSVPALAGARCARLMRSSAC